MPCTVTSPHSPFSSQQPRPSHIALDDLPPTRHSKKQCFHFLRFSPLTEDTLSFLLVALRYLLSTSLSLFRSNGDEVKNREKSPDDDLYKPPHTISPAYHSIASSLHFLHSIIMNKVGVFCLVLCAMLVLVAHQTSAAPVMDGMLEATTAPIGLESESRERLFT